MSRPNAQRSDIRAMPSSYQYVKISNKYLCLQQNPLVLAWFLFAKNNALQLQTLGLKKGRVVHNLRRFLEHRLHLRNGSAQIALPVSGHLCVAVHRGYKVFDFHRKCVVKVLDPKVNHKEVEAEIMGVRNAANLSFAPKIRGWNIRERWYEEDFVSGTAGYAIPDGLVDHLMTIYQQRIAPLIIEMILLHPLTTKRQGPYLRNLVASVESKRLSSPKLNGDKVEQIRKFAAIVAQKLSPYEQDSVALVFSHGDFSFVNILRTKEDMVVIDWESAALRSILNDFYNFFFTERYYQRVESNLITEMSEALTALQRNIMRSSPQVAEGIANNVDRYRWIYYLERIHMLLTRELNNKLLDVICRSIEVFNCYEEAVDNEPFNTPS